ncbi:MAG TPA: Hpt domain-containing protein, partial [Kofleriaceae bacterium]
MSDTDLDFDADELAMLRQLFRSEAHDALEVVTARVLATGSTKPTGEILNEMMRVTHTLKGAAGTVGLNVMVDLTHRLESAFAALGRDNPVWTATTGDLIVEVTDGLRGYLDHLSLDAAGAEILAQRIREQIGRIARVDPDARTRDSAPYVAVPDRPLSDPPSDPPAFRERPTLSDMYSASDSLSMPTI